MSVSGNVVLWCEEKKTHFNNVPNLFYLYAYKV